MMEKAGTSHEKQTIISSSYLTNALGKLHFLHSTSLEERQCSGLLLSNKFVITLAQNVYCQASKTFNSDFVFAAGQAEGLYRIANRYLLQDFISSQSDIISRFNNYALLELETAVTDNSSLAQTILESSQKKSNRAYIDTSQKDKQISLLKDVIQDFQQYLSVLSKRNSFLESQQRNMQAKLQQLQYDNSSLRSKIETLQEKLARSVETSMLEEKTMQLIQSPKITCRQCLQLSNLNISSNKCMTRANTLSQTALQHYSKREYSKAIHAYSECIRIYKQHNKIDKDYTRSLYQLGRVHVDMKYYRQALVCFQQSVGLCAIAQDKEIQSWCSVYIKISKAALQNMKKNQLQDQLTSAKAKQ